MRAHRFRRDVRTAFIGEREAATSGETDGTIIGYTAVRTDIVDAMGET
jgi:hypothetical protein